MIPQELLAKYSLPEDVAARAIERAVTRELRDALGKPVWVSLNSPLAITVLPHPWEDKEPVDLNPASLSEQLQRQIEYQIGKELEKAQTLREARELEHLQGLAVEGEIRRVNPDGSWSVVLEFDEFQKHTVVGAICPQRHIPPHERHKVLPGDTKSFFVSSVRPVCQGTRYRVHIKLSRTSIQLPALLIHQYTGKTVRCTRRIHGQISRIESSNRIPESVVKRVGDELNEAIHIHVSKP
ncbi:hypothetical protein [Geoalkalibacter halelectricus]|uniref:hypothetical protein n=1 Tax=Geoalkalibacter halelectricus TaxID=2847045 RepID=UPI00266FCD18|nr:hypothetical protein [Geoalkalibacter halelectricus]MDO3380370.1 hypothetical protein [Geoalkalibacter halelectricus]